MTAQQTYDDWAARGRTIDWADSDGNTNEIFVLDQPATADAGNDPLLVLHGFPTSSYDWAHVLPRLAAERRVILLDFLGFGLSSKPDLRYSMRLQADVAEAVAADLGLTSVAMITHDMGNTVGGELLRRSLEGTLKFEITRRVLTNGSIYIEMAQLTT
ncbi:MAG TPA: alpha/beta fold hydrolase, partial [Acidimicrobiia bacterium]|nr:alpha/beta fold hydrolase [Acidimicrobiia bacterium]